MNICVLVVAILATAVASLNTKYLPPNQSTGSLYGRFGSVGVAKPSREYLAPAASTSNGASADYSSGSFSTGAAISDRGVVAQPSRQYLAPAASASYGASAGFATVGPSFNEQPAHFSTGGFGTVASSHNVLAQPSNNYLAPHASASHDVSTGFSSRTHQYLTPATSNSRSVPTDSSDTKYSSNGGYEYGR